MQEVPTGGQGSLGFFATRRRWQVALLLSLVTAIGSIDRQAMAVTAARVKEAFGLDAVHYGQLGFAFLGALLAHIEQHGFNASLRLHISNACAHQAGAEDANNTREKNKGS